MFKPIKSSVAQERVIRIMVEDRAVEVQAGQPLATALLAAEVVPMRHTVVSGAPRAPLCLMGVCFDCLVEVDGKKNVQSCLVEVRDGMQVKLQHGARRLEENA